MVGKPNLPPDADGRSDKRGAARGTSGLSALDEEREASMADEGGASGMAVEAERPAVVFEEYEEPGLGFDLAVVGGVFVVGALTGWLLSRLWRD
jgi:hypothetical protein